MTDTTTLNQRVINRIIHCKNQRLHPKYQQHVDGLFDFSQSCQHFNIEGFENPSIEGIDMSYYEHTMSFVHFVGCSSFRMYFVGKKDGEWYGITYDRPAFEVTCNKLPDNFTFDGMKFGYEPDPIGS